MKGTSGWAFQAETRSLWLISGGAVVQKIQVGGVLVEKLQVFQELWPIQWE